MERKGGIERYKDGEKREVRQINSIEPDFGSFITSLNSAYTKLKEY